MKGVIFGSISCILVSGTLNYHKPLVLLWIVSEHESHVSHKSFHFVFFPPKIIIAFASLQGSGFFYFITNSSNSLCDNILVKL